MKSMEQLRCAVERITYRNEENGYTVLRWQACPTEEWESDDSLDLWDGVLF